eukprot:scaffold2544_cov141-Isochrysis_galbana.AAC.6
MILYSIGIIDDVSTNWQLGDLGAYPEICPWCARRFISIQCGSSRTDVRLLNSSSPIPDTLHNHLTDEYDLALQYTVNRTQQNPTTQSELIRQRHTKWVPEAGPTQEKHRRKRPVGSVTVGTLKRGPPLR